MKRYTAAIILSTLFTTSAFAGTAKVTWDDPDSYRDVRAAEENQTRFERRVFDGLEGHFQALAEKLPENHVLEITVKDLDLAGEVLPINIGGGMNLVRQVRNADFPAIEFDFKHLDESGNVVLEGNERLRGRDLPGQGRTNIQARSQHELLDYERAMLDRWFRFRFEE